MGPLSQWLDPTFWKGIAETFGYFQTIILSISAILAALVATVKWGFAPFRWIASKIWAKKKPAEQTRESVGHAERAYVMLDEKPIENVALSGR